MGQRTCSFPDCGGKVNARGMCRAHYDQERAGVPLRPLRRGRRPVAERFWEKADRSAGPDACWPWTAFVMHHGYGQFRVEVGVSAYAHRVAYELTFGPIGDGLVIDHLCHTRDSTCLAAVDCPHRRCVNPTHLEVVTTRINNLRGRGLAAVEAARTHCAKGHPYDEVNTALYRGARRCRACDREYHRREA